MAPRFSVVVPVRDEEGSLAELHRRLAAVLDELEGGWELILVDDGSVDGGYREMLALRKQDERVKLLRLS
ncbi:MAG TPA: glycosyltransferase, partial [Gaiellaceae bacterium]|nr:glycosyltransferase [Gaiellaceae bacterium]